MAMKREQIGIKKIKNQNKNSSSGCPDEGFVHPSQLSSLPMRAKVINSERENDIVTLLTLDLNMPNAKPGQFVMAWVVGMDEKPISIAETKPSLQLAVAAVGPCSKKLAEAKIGETIFVRGPLGKPFSPIGKRWVLVGGGYGFAPLRFLARIGIESGCKVQSICGARTKGLLLKKALGENFQTTDDGSAGTKGNVLAVLEPLLRSSKIDCVYSCGPEKMMKAVAECCKKYGVKCQLSVERYMKCAIGVCGHCAMGDWLSCWDGPTIDGLEALKNKSFGNYHTDRAGRKIMY